MSAVTAVISPTAIDAYVYIDSIRVVGRHRKDLGDLRSLAASIEDVGLLNPITLTPDSRLVAGERRLEACRLLGWDSIPVRMARNLDEAAILLRAERDENVERKEMLLSEKASLGEALYAIESADAHERQVAAGRRHGRGIACDAGTTTYSDRGGEPGGEQNKTRTVVGEALGMSGSTYGGLRYVYQAAHDEGLPPHVRAIAVDALAEMDRTNVVKPGMAKVRAAIRANREAQEAKAAALSDPGEAASQASQQHRPSQDVSVRDGPRSVAEQVTSGSDGAIAQRKSRLKELAASGMRSDQIAAEMGYASVDTVRSAARQWGITITADQVVGRARKIDANRVVRETVYALEGLAMGVQLVNVNALDPTETDGWASSMTDSIRALNRLVKALKEKTREA